MYPANKSKFPAFALGFGPKPRVRVKQIKAEAQKETSLSNFSALALGGGAKLRCARLANKSLSTKRNTLVVALTLMKHP
jgi:hypothetical protein